MYAVYTAPSVAVQNVMISNVTADVGDDIAIIVTWDPPSDPNGFIRYYRLEFEQTSDPLSDGSDDRAKRNIDLDDDVMEIFANFTDDTEAPTNITLSGLG